jgi:HSP20 family protein
VNRDAVRIMSKADTILIAGEKAPRLAGRDSSFHLVERGYGRFARVVRLNRACDTSKARARLVDGELHVTVPKVDDRRGKTVTIAIDAGGH